MNIALKPVREVLAAHACLRKAPVGRLAVIVNDQPQIVPVNHLAQRIRALYDALDALQLPLFPWPAGSKPHFVRIVPDLISGRRFAVTHGATSAS